MNGLIVFRGEQFSEKCGCLTERRQFFSASLVVMPAGETKGWLDIRFKKTVKNAKTKQAFHMCKRSLVESPHGIQIHLDLIFFFFWTPVF